MFSKLIRLGRDPELKYANNGTAILEITGAYDYGFGDRKGTQWITLALFGQRAESVANYLYKGDQLSVHADEIRVRAYINNNGEAGASLEGTLLEFDFVSAGGGQQQGQQQQQHQQRPQQRQQGGGGRQQHGGYGNAPSNQQGRQQQQQRPQQGHNNQPDYDDEIPY